MEPGERNLAVTLSRLQPPSADTAANPYSMVNIVFGSNFMGSDEFHELTGEPYLSSIHYGPPFKFLAPPFPLRPDKTPSLYRALRQRIFLKAHPGPRGRGTAYSTRKWPNQPYRALYKVWRTHKATLCRYGIHIAKNDIVEMDASIRRAECQGCHTLVKAHKPRPADDDEAQRITESNAEALKEHEKIVAYHEGRGPCPWCTPPEGELHEKDCWELDPEDGLPDDDE